MITYNLQSDGTFCALDDGERMSVACELWAYIEQNRGKYISSGQAEKLAVIAKHIDAEHEAACAEAYGNGVMSVPIALDESQWAKLPVDADGVPIHVGDVMESVASPSIHRRVDGVGAECFYAWEDGFGRYSQFDAPNYRHHHEPTVEDVLREFAERWDDPAHYAKGELVEQYAAKLKLAGDGE